MNCDKHLDFHPGCPLCAADRISELEWLAHLGETWTCLTVRRAGYPSLDAAERALFRAGRGDLVSRLRANAHDLGVVAYA